MHQHSILSPQSSSSSSLFPGSRWFRHSSALHPSPSPDHYSCVRSCSDKIRSFSSSQNLIKNVKSVQTTERSIWSDVDGGDGQVRQGQRSRSSSTKLSRRSVSSNCDISPENKIFSFKTDGLQSRTVQSVFLSSRS